MSVSLGTRLQQLREAMGMSQAAFALAASVPLDSLRNWEQDRNEPKAQMLVRLARALGVTLDEMMRGVGWGEDVKPAPRGPGRPRKAADAPGKPQDDAGRQPGPALASMPNARERDTGAREKGKGKKGKGE
jgi:transcriptional regulator with XRE-family HTH domain